MNTASLPAPTARGIGALDELVERLARLYELLGLSPARALASARADFAEELAARRSRP